MISGNGDYGVWIEQGASDNTVAGNHVGTDFTGTVGLDEQRDGVEIDYGAADNTIGGTSAEAGNVISGNSEAGVEIEGYEGVSRNVVEGNLVEGNDIGTDVTGTLPVSNGNGVLIDQGASDNTIGGTSSALANTIAFNLGNGVTVGSSPTDGTTGDEILGNSIYSNGSIDSNSGLGIDLGDDSVTLNDSEGHTGPNLFQDFPVITAATSAAGNTEISGTLVSPGSPVGTPFTIQFFASVAPANSYYGEGQTYLGETTVATTDASGNASFNDVEFPVALIDQDFITATATDPSGNTSEFSEAFLAQVTPPIVVKNTMPYGPDSLYAAIQAVDDSSTAQVIAFNIPVSDPGYVDGVFVIQPQTQLPAITTPVLIDATSQPGYKGTPIIQLDGGDAGAPPAWTLRPVRRAASSRGSTSRTGVQGSLSSTTRLAFRSSRTISVPTPRAPSRWAMATAW